MWACFKHRLKFNWAHSPKSLGFKPREERRRRKWQEISWLIPCWLVVISWVHLLGRFGVCLCSRSWPGAHGREDSAKSNAFLITWPPGKYPFLCCIVWLSYLFSGWESCYNSCFFSRSLTEFFCWGLCPCTKTWCPAWCLVVQRCPRRPEGNFSESLQALLFSSRLDM